jgi:hypothetical protein
LKEVGVYDDTVYTTEEIDRVITDNMNFYQKKYYLSHVENMSEKDFIELVNKYITGKDLYEVFKKYPKYFDCDLFSNKILGEKHILSKENFWNLCLNKFKKLDFINCCDILIGIERSSYDKMDNIMLSHIVKEMSNTILNKMVKLSLLEKDRNKKIITAFLTDSTLNKKFLAKNIIKKHNLYDILLQYNVFSEDEYFVARLFNIMDLKEIKECLISWEVPKEKRMKLLNSYFKIVNPFIFDENIETYNITFSDCINKFNLSKHNDYYYYISAILFLEGILTKRQIDICTNALIKKTQDFRNLLDRKKMINKIAKIAELNNNDTLKGVVLALKLM